MKVSWMATQPAGKRPRVLMVSHEYLDMCRLLCHRRTSSLVQDNQRLKRLRQSTALPGAGLGSSLPVSSERYVWPGPEAECSLAGPDSRKETDGWRIRCNDVRTSSVAQPVNAVQSSSDETQIPIAEPINTGAERCVERRISVSDDSHDQLKKGFPGRDEHGKSPSTAAGLSKPPAAAFWLSSSRPPAPECRCRLRVRT